MAVLVTGGSGYLGQFLIFALAGDNKVWGLYLEASSPFEWAAGIGWLLRWRRRLLVGGSWATDRGGWNRLQACPFRTQLFLPCAAASPAAGVLHILQQQAAEGARGRRGHQGRPQRAQCRAGVTHDCQKCHRRAPVGRPCIRAWWPQGLPADRAGCVPCSQSASAAATAGRPGDG